MALGSHTLSLDEIIMGVENMNPTNTEITSRQEICSCFSRKHVVEDKGEDINNVESEELPFAESWRQRRG